MLNGVEKGHISLAGDAGIRTALSLLGPISNIDAAHTGSILIQRTLEINLKKFSPTTFAKVQVSYFYRKTNCYFCIETLRRGKSYIFLVCLSVLL